MTTMRPLRGVGRYANPFLRPVARRLPPLAVVHHVGRRSGRAYRTPVLAYRTERGWVIALVYGADVDWVRNVVTAGEADLERRTRRYRLSRPEQMQGPEALAQLPRWSRTVMRSIRVREVLHLSSPTATPP